MNKHQIKKRKNIGFTLVELIIVITILAILATIAFISFKSYSSNARDGNRMTTLKNIETGLKLYSVKTSLYPDPDKTINIIGTGNTLLAKQGIIGPNITQVIKLNTQAFDPLDQTHFIYSISGKANKYQLGAYLEENNFISYFPQAYAVDYTNRYFYTLGDKIGIILETDNTILSQEKYSTGLHLEGNNTNFKVYFSNDSLSGSISGNGESLIEKIKENQNLGTYTQVQKTNAVCGEAGKIYESTDTAFTGGENKFCSTGTLDGTTPVFPSQGNSVSWSCISPDGGESTQCSAEKLNPNEEVKACSGKPSNSQYFGGSDTYSVTVSFGQNAPVSNYASVPTENSCDFSCMSGFIHENGQCIDKTPPTGGDFILPATTTSTSVTLNITCPTDAAGSNPIQMYISGSGLASGGNVWENCINTKNITLTSGNGTKSISIKWRDSNGNETTILNKNVSLNIPAVCGSLPNSYSKNLNVGGQQFCVVVNTNGSWGESCQTTCSNAGKTCSNATLSSFVTGLGANYSNSSNFYSWLTSNLGLAFNSGSPTTGSDDNSSLRPRLGCTSGSWATQSNGATSGCTVGINANYGMPGASASCSDTSTPGNAYGANICACD